MAKNSILQAIFALGLLLGPSNSVALPKVDTALQNRQSPPFPPPRSDPFYTAPAGFASRAPGTVLRSRTAPSIPFVGNSTGAYQLNYRTTDSNGQPSFAVTTVFLPSVAFNGTGTNLLSYQQAYDSADVDDSPSYAIYRPGNILDPSIPIALGLGWVVNTPDYEGPLAAFTAGRQSGHATLDSVRAALNFRSTLNLQSPIRYALWGYSGGALASEWAAELNAGYAPDLNFTGIALGGLTPNVTSVLLTVNNGSDATLIVSGILGQATQNASTEAYIRANLKPTGQFNASHFLAARNRSQTIGQPNAISYANENIFNYFTPGVGILGDTPLRREVNVDGQMGTAGVPIAPLFVYKGVQDEISPVADTDKLIAQYCATGTARIFYQRNFAANHPEEAIIGEFEALAFLGATFGGFYDAGNGCTFQNVTIPP